MCGIIGLFQVPNAEAMLREAFALLTHRGHDAFGFATKELLANTPTLSELHIPPTNNIVGHCLHAIVGNVPQPLKHEIILAANCEIYNWKNLAEKNNIQANNDAELLLHLIEKKGFDATLPILDGDYALLTWQNDTVTIARDIIGVKPLWYTNENNTFAVASERKVLKHLGYTTIHELNPRTILTYTLSTRALHERKRTFFTLTPEYVLPLPTLQNELSALLVTAVRKRIPEKKIGILFSGGIDSTLLAKICKDLGKEITCYTAVLDDHALSPPKDLEQAQRAAHLLHLSLTIIRVSLNQVETALPQVIKIIEDMNVTKVGVALPFYFASKAAAQDGVKVLFSGLGSEELFAGYERHKQSTNINNECLSGLRKIYERDLYRDDAITMHQTIELRVPYLDTNLINYSLKIPAIHKIHNGQSKYILRAAATDLGIPEELTGLKKCAAQYGSNFDKALAKLAKRNKFTTKSAYLRSFSTPLNPKLGVLFSSGKDSTYALHLMHQQNYDIRCLITLKSKNKDSYMFHTPNIDLAAVQAEALQLPIIIQETAGEKENELDDLKSALQKAKTQYFIEGVVTGALFSTYQRDRIEKICDELGLKIFSPLWHKNQEEELRELLEQNYHVIISSIASEGFTKEWLGKTLTKEAIQKIHTLHEKYHINPAFEGGEAETFVLDAPLFKKKIVIDEADFIMHDAYSGIYAIRKVHLEEKSTRQP